MTPSVSLNFHISEHSCSRDDEVALGIGSCHPTEFSEIASDPHHLPGCRLQQLLNVMCLLLSSLSCV